MIKGGVYAIINTQTGKSYIGSSYNLDLRFEQHRTMLITNSHHNKGLQRDFNKFDYDLYLFKFERLKEFKYPVPRFYLYFLEEKYIKNTKDKYNIQQSAIGHLNMESSFFNYCFLIVEEFITNFFYSKKNVKFKF